MKPCVRIRWRSILSNREEVTQRRVRLGLQGQFSWGELSDDELHLELVVGGGGAVHVGRWQVADGAVHGDEGGEDAEQEEHEDQVLDEANVLERDQVHHVHIDVLDVRSEISLCLKCKVNTERATAQ